MGGLLVFIAFVTVAMLVVGVWVLWVTLQALFYATALVIWAIYALATRNRGTPRPKMPRPKLPRTDLRQAYYSDRR